MELKGCDLLNTELEVEEREALERSFGLKSNDLQNVPSLLLGGKIFLEYLLVDALTDGDSDIILDKYD